MASLKFLTFCLLINFIRTQTIQSNGTSENEFFEKSVIKSELEFENIINSSSDKFSFGCMRDLKETLLGYKLKKPWAIACELILKNLLSFFLFLLVLDKKNSGLFYHGCLIFKANLRMNCK